MEFIAPDYRDNFIAHAYLAVDFFFCLPGFVIAYTYDDKLQSIRRSVMRPGSYDVVENQLSNHSGKTCISKKGNMGPPERSPAPHPAPACFQRCPADKPTCKALYERVYQRGGIKMKTYVAVQKRLMMAYALWRHGVDYNPLCLANRAEKDKKIVPAGGTTQDQVAEAELSYL